MSDATQAAPPTGTFCWNELASPDTAASAAFYTALMGWTTEVKDMGHMGTYTMFKKGETQVGGMYEMKGPQFEGVPPHWCSYVAVDDVDASTEKAESLGGRVCAPPFDIPDVGRMSVISDPTGAVIALFCHEGTC